jgi:glycosyltransferase involved in cell wall biosynthesis
VVYDSANSLQHDIVNTSVSVIVPTRNRPELLRICLEAISRQSMRALHIVVIDDGSTAEYAGRNEQILGGIFPDATYHYVDSAGAKGGGAAFSRNVGIKLARGRFIAFCDDDDYWIDNEHLAECVALFNQDAELDFVFANQQVREDGRVSTPKQTPVLPERLGIDPIIPGGKSVLLSKADCLLGWFAHMNTCVFRKELLQNIGGFWATTCFEDLDLYVRAVDVARKVRYLDRTVAVHNNAASSRREAITTELAQMDIKVCAVNVASHLLHTVRDKAAVRYARRMAGDAYRWLALEANRTADRRRAAAFAQLGLAARFSLKWAVMTLLLSASVLVAA